jgi:hypothetical protein
MTYNEFKVSVEKLSEYKWNREEMEIESGGVVGLYAVFAKWKENEYWVFSRAFETYEGLKFFVRAIPEDIFNQQYIKILFVHCNNGENYTDLLLSSEVKEEVQ